MIRAVTTPQSSEDGVGNNEFKSSHFCTLLFYINSKLYSGYWLTSEVV